MNLLRSSCAALAAFSSSLLPLAAQQPLGHAVPDDIHIYVHGTASPTPDPSVVRFEQAMARVIDSGLHEDLFALATQDMSDRQRDEIRGVITHVFGLLDSVDWADLASREIVFAEKLSMPMPEFMMVFRSGQDEAGKHVSAVKKMLEGFAEMAQGAAEVRIVERRTGDVTVFEVDGAPVQIAAGAVGDAVIMSTSVHMTASAMKRMQNDGAGSIVEDARFRRSASEVPHGSESTAFIDIRSVLGMVGGTLNMAAGGAERMPPEARRLVSIADVVLQELDVFDHVFVSTQSDGRAVTSTSLMRLSDDFSDTRLAKMFSGQTPWKNWHESVPADATSFVFDSGMNIDEFMEMIAHVASEGLADFDVHPWWESRRWKEAHRIAGHLSGEVATVSFPTAGENGCTLGETVFAFKLEKTEGVANWIEGHLHALARFLKSRGQAVEIRSDDGFHEMRLEAFPWIRPTIGVFEGQVVLATSPAAIDRIDRVRRGMEPNIRSSDRFRALEIDDNDGYYVDYGQIDHSLGGIPDLVSAVGFFLSVMPEDRDTREAIQVGRLLSKIGPVLRALDLSMDYGGAIVESKSEDAVVTKRVYRHH